MKRYLWVLVILLLFIYVGCKENNTIIEEDKKVTINYYNGAELIETKEYINNTDNKFVLR